MRNTNSYGYRVERDSDGGTIASGLLADRGLLAEAATEAVLGAAGYAPTDATGRVYFEVNGAVVAEAAWSVGGLAAYFAARDVFLRGDEDEAAEAADATRAAYERDPANDPADEYAAGEVAINAGADRSRPGGASGPDAGYRRALARLVRFDRVYRAVNGPSGLGVIEAGFADALGSGGAGLDPETVASYENAFDVLADARELAAKIERGDAAARSAVYPEGYERGIDSLGLSGDGGGGEADGGGGEADATRGPAEGEPLTPVAIVAAAIEAGATARDVADGAALGRLFSVDDVANAAASGYSVAADALGLLDPVYSVGDVFVIAPEPVAPDFEAFEEADEQPIVTGGDDGSYRLAVVIGVEAFSTRPTAGGRYEYVAPATRRDRVVYYVGYVDARGEVTTTAVEGEGEEFAPALDYRGRALPALDSPGGYVSLGGVARLAVALAVNEGSQGLDAAGELERAVAAAALANAEGEAFSRELTIDPDGDGYAAAAFAAFVAALRAAAAIEATLGESNIERSGLRLGRRSFDVARGRRSAEGR